MNRLTLKFFRKFMANQSKVLFLWKKEDKGIIQTMQIILNAKT